MHAMPDSPALLVISLLIVYTLILQNTENTPYSDLPLLITYRALIHSEEVLYYKHGPTLNYTPTGGVRLHLFRINHLYARLNLNRAHFLHGKTVNCFWMWESDQTRFVDTTLWRITSIHDPYVHCCGNALNIWTTAGSSISEELYVYKLSLQASPELRRREGEVV